MSDSILLVHEDPSVLRAIGARFEESGQEVIRELSIDAGVATLARLTPDAVLLSLSLGAVAGAIESLRTDDVPVVVFGDRPDPADAARAIDVGAVQVVDTAAGSGVLLKVAALVARVAPTDKVGSVTGVVGAAGGLGGFIPPLIMGYFYGLNGSYTIGFVLLALLAGAAAAYTWTAMRRADA